MNTSDRSPAAPPRPIDLGAFDMNMGDSSRPNTSDGGGSAEVPRPKRIACVVCRKRKLRCDGSKPSCGTCARLGHECAYDEVRRKSGPKRGYVKALEARLAQVETLLNDKSVPRTAPPQPSPPPPPLPLPPPPPPPLSQQSSTRYASLDPLLFGDPIGKDGDMLSASERFFMSHSTSVGSQHPFDADSPIMDMPMPMPNDILDDPPLSWELMALGLAEPLPAQEVIDSLHRTYFEKVHPSIPILHKGRYLASLDMPPSMRPPTHLRYAIWTMAASVSDEHVNLQTHFYKRARKYIDEAELKGHGESIISVAASQTWSLIACYEFKLMYFPRAWLSTGRAVRLAQMMGMHRLDGVGLDVKQCLPAPKDWCEREERRRTFWIAFCIDRYASIGTGWPMTVEERDILTNLPSTEDAFERGRSENSMSLKEAMTPDGASRLSPYAGVCLMACLFGRNLIHLHRPDCDGKDADLQGQFWTRHRYLDHILLNIALSLPSHFRLPTGINNANIVFTNLNIHTSTICLHQAAIFKADKNKMPATVSAESKIRCITAAAEIANIMRMVCHLDLSGMNPFISFCLYVAARVFVQYLKSRPRDEQVRASLQFLLTAMGHLKKKNPLTESFLVQLDVDLTGSIDLPENASKFPFTLKKGEPELYPECLIGTQCSAMMPNSPDESYCDCMAADVRALVERHAAMGPPTCVPDQLTNNIPALCVCMTPEVRSFLEACVEYSLNRPEYTNGLHSDNGHSPASMDMSDNLTPSSSGGSGGSGTGHPAGSAASYSPLGFSDSVVPPQYEPAKDSNWELLDFGTGDYYIDPR